MLPMQQQAERWQGLQSYLPAGTSWHQPTPLLVTHSSFLTLLILASQTVFTLSVSPWLCHCRALLVDEVTYEPSSLLKKSRKAVVLITGADLVLVKMTSITKVNSSASRSTGTAGGADGAAAAAAGSTTAAAAATAPGAAAGPASGRSDAVGLDASAALAADATASVLAQHELHKVQGPRMPSCTHPCTHWHLFP